MFVCIDPLTLSPFTHVVIVIVLPERALPRDPTFFQAGMLAHFRVRILPGIRAVHLVLLGRASIPEHDIDAYDTL